MKKFLIILTILISFCSELYSFDYWMKIPAPTTKRLQRVSILDSLNIFAVGDSSTVLKTTNGGLNWTSYNFTQLFFLNSISFSTPNIGWIIAIDRVNFTGSKLLHTTNKGLYWEVINFWDTTESLSSISFADSLNGWIGAHYGTIYKTTDGGNNWLKDTVGTSPCMGFPIFRVRALNKNYVFACGGAMDVNGVAWTYYKDLEIWKGACVSNEPNSDIYIFDSLNAICSGGDFEFGVQVVITNDGGKNWKYNPLFIFGIGESISFRTRNEGWFVTGFTGQFGYSLDTGNTWITFYSQDSAALYDVKFINHRIGWAVGDKGSIYKYNTGIIGMQNESGNFPENYKLLQNYPNPFNSTTIIKFDLKKSSPIQIKIYDINGRLIQILFDGYKEKGYHSILFSNDNLASGIYFCEMSVLKDYKIQFSTSKKIVLVK